MSNLHRELAGRIRQHLAESSVAPGDRLVEDALCRRFHVSRTPIRGALKLLEDDGVVTARPGRGYVLAAAVTAVPEPVCDEDSEDARLFEAIAQARQTGALPDQITQQEVLRRFGVRAAIAARVLARLEGLGLLEPRPGHGWRFIGESGRAQQESYAFRRALEPALLLLPSFRLDHGWAQESRAAHLALRAKRLGPGDADAFHALNANFHEHLARCCGNRHMREAVEKQVALRRFLSRRWNYPVAQIHAALDEHLEILAALEQGYADKASALMRHHLTQSASTSAQEQDQEQEQEQNSGTKISQSAGGGTFSGAGRDTNAG